MLEGMSGGSLAIGGFAQAARELGWTLVPSVWAGAMPSNRVTAAAFERIAGEIVEDLRAARELDAVYLDLHGAAVAEGFDDAEGELLARVRAAIGPAMPVVASLDLHANVTAAMLRHASGMTAYRTYPHVDMRETGERAARMLEARLSRRARPRLTRAQRVPFLLPLNAQSTALEPARSLIALRADLEREHGVEIDFAMGFSAADFAECGPVVFGHGDDDQALQRAVGALHHEVLVQRANFRLELETPRDAVERALALTAGGEPPVVIADTQDNPGAGGDSNTTGLLHALIAARAGERAAGRIALGLLFDPSAADAAFEAGLHASFDLVLGAQVAGFDGAPTDPPVRARGTVRALHDAPLPLHGPMTAGHTIRLGRCARIDVDGIQVLVASAKAQMLDLDLMRFLGVEPAAMRLLVVKSSVHFRAAFAPIASRILVAKAHGPMAADPGELHWRHLDPGTATRP
jgi:microcystin degradation protein MlrC